MIQVPAWAAGIVLAPAVAGGAYRAGSLSVSGAIAASAVGVSAMTAGWGWGALLVAYFVSASMLSRWRADEKDARAGGRVEKSGRRDAMQVLANGGLFAVCALAWAFDPSPIWQATAAGALAASAADTWATEIGVLAPKPPRSIVYWRPVAPGTSGGVTAQGFLGAAAGAAFVTIGAALLRWPPEAIAGAFVGGLLGAVVDSVAGATLQARRFCARCDEATEARVHHCGATTTVTGGLAFVDNDGVNLLATLFGAIVGAATATFGVGGAP